MLIDPGGMADAGARDILFASSGNDFSSWIGCINKRDPSAFNLILHKKHCN